MKEHTEPHFDDEQTLREARPVVPLEQINAEVRHRRLWFLAGAFAVAMILGAASALLAFYVKLRNAPQVATEVSAQQPQVDSEQVAVAESVPSETPVVEDENPETSEPEESEPEDSEEATPPTVTPRREAAVRPRTVAPRHNAEQDERRDTRQLSEEDELNRIRQAVLYDEWQERRARRVARRERRRAERYNHRNLSNLNEIFEGRRP
ncbi:MAG TPA: hypothetical protein VKB02_04640 [Pyrinomonadaceae bacterium]|nr:hypothetical protein [Pyrinomonadaceae bacterium]